MKIRIFLVEDSSVQRRVLAERITSDGDIEVIGWAETGSDSLVRIPILKPDIVVMDAELPGMSGPEAIAKLLQVYPVPVILFTESPEKWKDTAEQAGAVAVLSKSKGSQISFATLRKTVRLMNGLKIIKRHGPRVQNTGDKRFLLIAASSGGPSVVESILREVRPSSGVIVILAQHLSENGTEFFAKWLEQATEWRCELCRGPTRLQPGRIYLSATGQHMRFVDGLLILEPSENPGEFSPSATILFQSFAKSCPRDVVAVVASGIGDDGAKGLLALRIGGATTIAQDPTEAAVSGMPEAAVAYGGAARVVATRELGRTVQMCLEGTVS